MLLTEEKQSKQLKPPKLMDFPRNEKPGRGKLSFEEGNKTQIVKMRENSCPYFESDLAFTMVRAKKRKIQLLS